MKHGVVMNMMMTEFREYVAQQFNKAIEKTHGEDEELIAVAATVDAQLNTVRSLEGIAKCVRWKLSIQGKIEWNKNPMYTVFPNGVLQLDKRDSIHSKLYYFGKTDPEEYVNDERCWKLPYGCPPLNFDGSYITEAEDLLRDWIDLVQPVPEDKCLLLTYLGLVLKAINYKKMIINVGHTGDNAKSSFFEMLVDLAGGYGVTGDKNLIVKGKKDRVSKAVLHLARIVLFEEPDPTKPLNIEFLKDLVGGATKAAARLNFSNDTEILLHCKTVLNANTMTTVQLEEAIMTRLLYLAWTTKFTSDPKKVDPKNRIYLADEKFKTAAYWDSKSNGLLWLLLNHYRLFELQGNKLKISARQNAKTKQKLLDQDLFIIWFRHNYVFLTDTEANRKKFVTREEIIAEFSALTPSKQQTIIGRRLSLIHI